MKVDELIGGVLASDRRAVARAISMVEDDAPGLPELSRGLHAQTGNAHTVGLTGSPGVGKSSLTEHLVRMARAQDRRVAVLAIDPTSPFTGGALLGDRLRMQTHATDPGVFIRSMATRGHLGGMALAAPEAIRVLDAAGNDLIFVETVGVGQAEVQVASAADTTLVVVSPGWGDAVQVSKAGILEIADVFVVNKADREGGSEAVRDLETMIRMGEPRGWTPPVVKTSATTGDGVGALWEAIESHRERLVETGELARRRRARIAEELEDMVSQRLRRDVAGMLEGELSAIVEDVAERKVDPYEAAGILLERVRGSNG